MQAGKLNRLVTIQHQTAGQDEAGQPVTTWADLAQAWANIRYLSGIETIKGDAQTSVAKASIRIRFRTDVTAAMRVSIGETVFQIKAVMPDASGRQFVDLACEALS